jgi:hypothetical protein
MCVLISSTNFVWNISQSRGTELRRHDQNTTEYLAVFMKTARYSCPAKMKLEFYRQFLEKYSIWTFKKIRQVGGELFHADKRTDMTKLIVAFHNFANIPKNVSNVPPAPKLWQRCLIQLPIALRLKDRKKSLSVLSFRLSFPFLLHTALTSCFLISSKWVLIKIRLKSAGKSSV